MFVLVRVELYASDDSNFQVEMAIPIIRTKNIYGAKDSGKHGKN